MGAAEPLKRESFEDTKEWKMHNHYSMEAAQPQKWKSFTASKAWKLHNHNSIKSL